MPISKVAQQIARAMAVQEGWNKPTSEQFPNRNPGNMMDVQYWQKEQKFRLNVFATWSAGWDALANLVQKRCIDQDRSILEFLAGDRVNANTGEFDPKGITKPGGYYGYCPFGHGANDPVVYATAVGSMLGIDATKKPSTGAYEIVKSVLYSKLPVYGAQGRTSA